MYRFEKNFEKYSGEINLLGVHRNMRERGCILEVNPLFHNVEKWPNIIKKSCDVNTARF